MKEGPAVFYTTGGTLRHDAPSYVERTADRELLSALASGEYCYVLTSRQMGKSSLMVQTARKLRAEGRASVVVLDLTSIGQNLTAEQWYDGLLLCLGRQLHLEDALEQRWLERSRLGPVHRFFQCLRDVVLDRIQPRLILFIDELDAVRSLRFSSDEFFAAIRECYNRRAQDPAYSRLAFCLLGVATPSSLIRDPRMAPFNIGRRVVLSDFSLPEAQGLARGLGKAEASAPLLARAFEWTHGHPYLTQRLCRAISEAENPPSGRARWTAGEVDLLCANLFLNNRARERDDNLLFVRERMLRSDHDRTGLLHLYQQVLKGKRVADDETNPQVSDLRLAGITRVDRGVLRVRNRIYRRVFDLKWVRSCMPDAELRRQREAFRRGLIRAMAGAALILVLMLYLAATAVDQSREARERLMHLNTFNGTRLMQSGHYFSSMMWFAENLKLTRPSGKEEDFQRRRMASILHHSPTLTRLFYHTAAVNDAAFSPVDPWIVSASDDKTAKVWNVQSGQLVYPALKHDSPVTLAIFSPDGSIILTATGHQNAYLWNAKNGAAIGRPLEHDYEILDAAFSPDSQKVVTTSFDDTARVWDAHTGEPLTPPLAHKDAVVDCAISPDGMLLATASADRTARLWEMPSGRPRFPEGFSHSDAVTAVDFHPNSRMLLTASMDGAVALWDVSSGEPLGREFKHRKGVDSACFSPDGSLIATACRDGYARVWQTEGGDLLFPPFAHGDAVTSVSFSPDGSAILSVCADQTARVWDLTSGEPMTPALRHNEVIQHAAFRSDGQLILTAGADSLVKVWDLAGALPAIRIWPHPSEAIRVKFSRDGRLIATATRDGDTVLRNASTGRPGIRRLHHNGEVKHIAFSPDGTLVATASFDNTAKIWETRTGALLHTLQHEDTVGYVEFDAASRRIITASRDKRALVWDVATGRQVLAPLVHDFEVVAATFGAGGKRIITASADNATFVWDEQTGQRLTGPIRTGFSVGRPVIAPTKQYVAAATGPDTVRVYELEHGRPITPPIRHRAAINRVAFDPRATRIVTASSDRSARVWSLDGGTPLTPPLRHDSKVQLAAFSPDGNQVLTAGADHAVRLWSALTGEPLGLAMRTEDPIVDAAFRPNASELATISGREARLWDISSDTRPKADLILHAELLSGEQRDSTGGLVPIPPLRLREIWQGLSSKYPQYFNGSREAARVWHRQRIFHNAEANNRQAVEFHFKHLRGRGNASKALYSRIMHGILPRGQPRTRGGQRPVTKISKIIGEQRYRESLPAAIPSRPPNAPPTAVNLSSYYNGDLGHNWRLTGNPNLNLRTLPTGLRRLGQIVFDIRGVLQLSGQQALGDSRRTLPKEVRDIKVSGRCARIHLLHATAGSDPPGTEVARIALHYQDGQEWQRPILYGTDVLDGWDPTHDPKKATAKVAWSGPAAGPGLPRLFVTTIPNPRPDVPLASVDLISSMADSAPFLVAMTVDPPRAVKRSAQTGNAGGHP